MSERPSPQDVTAWLSAWHDGDAEAGDRLMPLVYEQLRRQAAAQLRGERRDHTLRPTALVHEAYLRLAEQNAGWRSREQFFAVAARLMRRILVDHARHRTRVKRGGEWIRVPLDDLDDVAIEAAPDVDLLALDGALSELQELAPDQVRLIELRYFGGLSGDETAELLGVSPSTVDREWRLARAWLARRLGGADPGGAS